MKTKVLQCGEGRITQKFKSSHKALDLVALKNGKSATDWVLSLYDGDVVAAGYNTTKGYYCIIEDEKYEITYQHFKTNTLSVWKGDCVKAGQVLGYTGNTGKSKGAHLHIAVKENGKFIDPTPLVFEEEETEEEVEEEEEEMSKEDLVDLAERTIATGAETALGVIGSSTLISSVDWKVILSATFMAMIVCVLKWAVKLKNSQN